MLCFHAAQTGKHLLRTQNVSEQNQKHFLCPGHKICCARVQTGKHLCPQQCVRNNVSSIARALTTRFELERVTPRLHNTTQTLITSLWWTRLVITITVFFLRPGILTHRVQNAGNKHIYSAFHKTFDRRFAKFVVNSNLGISLPNC